MDESYVLSSSLCKFLVGSERARELVLVLHDLTDADDIYETPVVEEHEFMKGLSSLSRALPIAISSLFDETRAEEDYLTLTNCYSVRTKVRPTPDSGLIYTAIPLAVVHSCSDFLDLSPTIYRQPSLSTPLLFKAKGIIGVVPHTPVSAQDQIDLWDQMAVIRHQLS